MGAGGEASEQAGVQSKGSSVFSSLCQGAVVEILGNKMLVRDFLSLRHEFMDVPMVSVFEQSGIIPPVKGQNPTYRGDECKHALQSGTLWRHSIRMVAPWTTISSRCMATSQIPGITQDVIF